MKKKASYTIVENEILEDEAISSTEKLILIIIKSYVNQKKLIAYPSYDQIAKRASIKSRSTVRVALKSLVEKGYLDKREIVGRGNEYKIILGGKGQQKVSPYKEKNYPTPKQNLEGERDKFLYPTNINTSTIKNNSIEKLMLEEGWE